MTGDVLVHLSSSEYERLSPLTPENLTAIWDELHAAAEVMDHKAFLHVQMKRGFKYSPYGIQRSPIRAVARFPRGLLADWMHNLVASGGVAQFEVGQFIMRLVDGGSITFDTLQNLVSCLRFPKAGGRLSLRFQDRIVMEGIQS